MRPVWPPTTVRGLVTVNDEAFSAVSSVEAESRTKTTVGETSASLEGTPLSKVHVTSVVLDAAPVPVKPSILQSMESAVLSKFVPVIVIVVESVTTIPEIEGELASMAS